MLFDHRSGLEMQRDSYIVVASLYSSVKDIMDKKGSIKAPFFIVLSLSFAEAMPRKLYLFIRLFR